jgi:cytochrome bd-type quinol oxidase subunit 1
MDALTLHRIHFAFTITCRYLFPQLTMGLALLIVILKTLALKTGDEKYAVSARFWAKIFAVNFLLGVVTGIPLEFQFGPFSAHSQKGWETTNLPPDNAQKRKSVKREPSALHTHTPHSH